MESGEVGHRTDLLSRKAIPPLTDQVDYPSVGRTILTRLQRAAHLGFDTGHHTVIGRLDGASFGRLVRALRQALR